MHTAATKSKAPAWPAALGLALLTVWLFWPATHCDFISYDDPLYVTANPHVQAGLTTADLRWAFLKPEAYYGYWHPLTLVSHMLDCQLYGLKPAGHHLTGILLHAVNAALVFLLLHALTRSFWRSLMVAALFAWHPLRVESVAWVSEHKGPLSALFGLLSLLAYVRYVNEIATPSHPPNPANPHQRSSNVQGFPLSRRTGEGRGEGRTHKHGKSKIYYALSLLAFAASLLCKPMLLTLPFVMLLLDWWPLGRMTNSEFRIPNFKSRILNLRSFVTRNSKLVIEKTPFLALVAVMGAFTVILSREAGALDADRTLSLGARAGNALVSYCRYLEKMLWPSRLAVFYPHPGHWPTADVLAAGATLAILTALLFALRRRSPYAWMGWLWFVGTLVPPIGLMQIGSQAMADRYTYFPCLGLWIAIVWGLSESMRRWAGRTLALPMAAALALVVFGVLTHTQLTFWQDSETLFREALNVTDNNFMAHRIIGDCLYQQGNVNDAIHEYGEALRIEPEYTDALNNLGIALGSEGRNDDAIALFKTAIQLKPKDAQPHNNLGLALGRKGELDEAVAEFIESIRLDPEYADPHNNLGIALIKQGHLDEAISQFQEALRLKPGYSDAADNLKRALTMKNTA